RRHLVSPRSTLRVPPVSIMPGHVATRMLPMVCLAALLACATSASGCAQTTDTYAGTATLVANGAASADVSAQSIRLADCSKRAAPLYMLDLGDHCYFPGRWTSPGVFVGESGRTCVLSRPGTSDEAIRVTDVSARLQPSGRTADGVDGNLVDVRIGGDLVEAVEPPRHVLYTFSGVFVASEAAGKRCLALVP
ncbi:MAG TPA: hypothetical protein VII82_13215, partial [Polyangiaceae bacterium]